MLLPHPVFSTTSNFFLRFTIAFIASHWLGRKSTVWQLTASCSHSLAWSLLILHSNMQCFSNSNKLRRKHIRCIYNWNKKSGYLSTWVEKSAKYFTSFWYEWILNDGFSKIYHHGERISKIGRHLAKLRVRLIMASCSVFAPPSILVRVSTLMDTGK